MISGVLHKPSEQAKSAQASPRFGMMAMAQMTKIFAGLERNPIGETLAKDVLGFNMPRVVVTRTWKERLDVATSEFSNTLVTIVGTLALPWLIRHPVQWISGVKMQHLAGEAIRTITPKIKLARLAASFGFMFPFAAAFWSTPFFRNLNTLRRFNTANYESLIGLETQSNKTEKRSTEEEKKHQKRQIVKILGIGAALGAASILLFGLAARFNKVKSFTPLMNRFFKAYELKGKGANQVADLYATYIFWSLPAYLGWMHAARSKNELKEQVLKLANSTLWFTLFTPATKPLYLKGFNSLLAKAGLPALKKVPSYQEVFTKYRGVAPEVQKGLLKLKNMQYGIGFLITLFMLGITPQLLNIYLTKRRVQQQQEAKGAGISETQHRSNISLSPKTVTPEMIQEIMRTMRPATHANRMPPPPMPPVVMPPQSPVMPQPSYPYAASAWPATYPLSAGYGPQQAFAAYPYPPQPTYWAS